MLKRRALQATLWSGAEIFLRQGLQFVATVLLARLLGPTEFGTMALLALFTGIATVLVDGGFSAALIQSQDSDRTDESTVFWFNLAIAVIMALAMCAIAPAVASFYASPVLVPLMYVMAINLMVASLGAIHTTLLTRRLEFRTLMKVSSLSTLAASATAVWMAWQGYGVWALAGQAVVMATFTTGLLWLCDDWRPAWTFRSASARKLFGFGGYHLGSTLLDIVYTRLYTLLIGRYYGIRDLGIYSTADTTRQMPTGFLNSVLGRVAFPMFATQAGNPAMLRRGMQLSLRGMMLINAPVMLGIAALAEPLVQVLFGSQWLEAAPILSVLCLAGVLLPVHVINLQALMAQGESRRMFHIEVTKKVLGAGLIVGGASYGVMGIAWSQAIFSVLGIFLNAYHADRLVHYGVLRQARDFMPVVFIAALMAGLVQFIAGMWNPPALLELATLSVLGAAVFFVMAWSVNLEALRDVAELFRNRAPETGVAPESVP